VGPVYFCDQHLAVGRHCYVADELPDLVSGAYYVVFCEAAQVRNQRPETFHCSRQRGANITQVNRQPLPARQVGQLTFCTR